MYKILFIFSIISLLATGCKPVSLENIPPSSNSIELPTVCQEDAKVCADGSTVSRSGPKCEFEACPNSTTDSQPSTKPSRSGVEGNITMGPVCAGPEMARENCYKPYKVDMQIMSLNGKEIVAEFSSDIYGKYNVSLDPGSYIIVSNDLRGSNYSGGYSGQVTVTKNKYTRLDINIDSGMR